MQKPFHARLIFPVKEKRPKAGRRGRMCWKRGTFMTMTSDAKSKLSKTIRALRERLLTELSEATDREYRLSVRSKDAKLDTARTTKRKRLEDWLAEQVRAETGKQKRTKDDFRREAEKQAAYTLLNRLVILRLMEATGLRKPVVVTGGWESRGYKDFRELAPALVRTDESEGYAFLLQLIFEDLATDLPGLYGSAGIADLIPVPAATMRAVVEALDDPELEICWTDDMTLGWVYQYWNDPEREALDAKLNDGGKIEPHEIASKTQMFTERYMVDWLLQNSLGPMWLAMCKKHGWTPEVEADGTLERLEQRRVEWRAKRDAGEVELTELMPLHTDAERRWAYYVPQPIPDDAVEHAPESVRDLKILDPAVGSGHFLVVAFDLLVALYQEEARHRGEVGRRNDWSGRGDRRTHSRTQPARHRSRSASRADRGRGAVAEGAADVPGGAAAAAEPGGVESAARQSARRRPGAGGTAAGGRGGDRHPGEADQSDRRSPARSRPSGQPAEGRCSD